MQECDGRPMLNAALGKTRGARNIVAQQAPVSGSATMAAARLWSSTP